MPSETYVNRSFWPVLTCKFNYLKCIISFSKLVIKIILYAFTHAWVRVTNRLEELFCPTKIVYVLFLLPVLFDYIRKPLTLKTKKNLPWGTVYSCVSFSRSYNKLEFTVLTCHGQIFSKTVYVKFLFACVLWFRTTFLNFLHFGHSFVRKNNLIHLFFFKIELRVYFLLSLLP